MLHWGPKEQRFPEEGTCLSRLGLTQQSRASLRLSGALSLAVPGKCLGLALLAPPFARGAGYTGVSMGGQGRWTECGWPDRAL